MVPRSVARLFRLWRRTSSAEAKAVYSAYSGGDVVDVGAFHGFYSLLLAPKAKRGDVFVSLEPDQRAFPTLLSNLAVASALFPGVKFIALPLAVGDGTALEIGFQMGANAHPTFGSRGPSGAPDASIAFTLDSLVSLLNLRPFFVKIDVEGAEYFVLSGMCETLAKRKPTMMLEVHPHWQPKGITAEAIEKLLKEHAYRRWVITDDELAIRLLVSAAKAEDANSAMPA
jgi:FkbM family methyltransferase